MPTWLGQLMCDGATPEEAVERVKAYEKLIRPPITPKQVGLRPTLYCKLPPVLNELDQVRGSAQPEFRTWAPPSGCI